MLQALARGRCSDFGVPTCNSTAFSPLREAAVQEVQLAILAAARSQVRHFCFAALRPTALQPAACSLAVRNLLPAALQCTTCCLQPCSLQPCSLPAFLQYSDLASSQRQHLNLISVIHLINLFSLIDLINSMLARTLVCDVQVCSNLAARQPPVWVGGIGRTPVKSPETTSSELPSSL